ncbi:hypothetical protein DFH09DRAFT_1273109 [Mycena vulgaris]|nr:hypothetical protein DFH09DRAFT_1273109 [Mycena vulgaris]
MPTYNSFAVVGGGTIGLPILNALAAKHVSVVLLTRPESSTKVVPAGVQVAKVDFDNASAIVAVLKEHKVEVVLSTIGTPGAAAQKPLVEAAKLAAVKLFVPSEYGNTTEGYTEGVLGDKNRIAGKNWHGARFASDLKAAGIPSARFYTGLFPEAIPRTNGYAKDGIFRIVGKGEAPVSFTSVPDIAGFVAHVLTALPRSELEDRVFRLEGERASMNEVGALFKTSVQHVDNMGEGGEFLTFLLAHADRGAFSTGWDETVKAEGSGSKAAGSSNALWPDHKWQTIKEVLKL